MMQSMGEAASSILVAGSAGTGQVRVCGCFGCIVCSMTVLMIWLIMQGSQSARIMAVLNGNGKVKPMVSKTVQNSLNNAASKGSSLFEKFKSSKVMGKLGNLLGKLNMNAPVHLIDSMITYAIGVVSGMQDMAQVIF